MTAIILNAAYAASLHAFIAISLCPNLTEQSSSSLSLSLLLLPLSLYSNLNVSFIICKNKIKANGYRVDRQEQPKIEWDGFTGVPK